MKRKVLHKELGLSEKRIPFGTPDGYFENFSDELFAKIDALEETNKPKGRKVFLKPWVRKVASIAAILLIVYVPSQLIFNKVMNTETQDSFSEMDYMHLLDESQMYDLMSAKNDANTDLDQSTLEEAVFASVTDYELYSMK